MNILIFIGVLGLLIFIHEFGHFIAAKLTGMKVEEFSIGFKPAIFEKKIGETNYVLGAIPIGGYVKILGENPDEEETKKLSEKDKKRTFNSKPKWAQITVLSMGVIFNLLLAWIFISLSLFIGTYGEIEKFPKEYIKEKSVWILSTVKNTPAEEIGFKGGEKILEISSESKKISKPESSEVISFLQKYHKNIVIKYQNSKNEIQNTEEFDLIKKNDKYIAGFYLKDLGKVEVPFFKSFYYGFFATIDKIKEISSGLFNFFGDIFKAKADLDAVSGPVGMVKIIGDVAQTGFVSLLIFTALLSINLAIINFLPFPALDGGRVMFILIELLTRKKIPEKIFNWINFIGFGFLILLMFIITINDVWKLFK